jgi:hypothetical protein
MHTDRPIRLPTLGSATIGPAFVGWSQLRGRPDERSVRGRNTSYSLAKIKARCSSDMKGQNLAWFGITHES